MSARPRITARSARTLLMDGQGLLDDPSRGATAPALARLIRQLGFVQVDSINVVDRAHHLTLGSRLEGYRPDQLTRLLEQERGLFEHWTHDAAVIPTEFFVQWKPRFRRSARSSRLHGWIHRKIGEDPKAVLARVKRRLRAEGPLMTRDFAEASDGPRDSWWGWTPARAALEYLWHTGDVTIRGRRNFHKVYDLTERVFPELAALRSPGRAQHREWACSGAMDRLAIATPGELAKFWDAITPAEAAAWCRRAQRSGRIVAVEVEDAIGGVRRAAFAAANWEERLARCPAPPAGVRLLSPFDPVIRDRRRLLRRFGFDHHFEAFVPPARRRWGYYVLPILEGDRLVGRLDPKFHRDRSVLEVKRTHWEPGVRATKARRRDLDRALGVLADRIGAREIEIAH